MQPQTPARKATVAVLAAVGLITLIVLGIALAVYSARYVPRALDRLGAAAGYVIELFVPGEGPALTVVPTASTTIPFGETASSTDAAGAGETAPGTRAATGGPAPIYYRTAATTYPVAGSTRITVPPAYSGLPDLQAAIVDVGYIDASGTFIATSTIKSSDTLAANILITNLGTNKSGEWTVRATIPTTASADSSQTAAMSSLEPNQPVRIDLKLSSGRPRTGVITITVTADPDGKVAESNEGNNTAAKSITVQ